MPGCPSWKTAEIGFFRPEEKGLFPRISSDLLKPPPLKPPFAALQVSGHFSDISYHFFVVEFFFLAVSFWRGANTTRCLNERSNSTPPYGPQSLWTPKLGSAPGISPLGSQWTKKKSEKAGDIQSTLGHTKRPRN